MRIALFCLLVGVCSWLMAANDGTDIEFLLLPSEESLQATVDGRARVHAAWIASADRYNQSLSLWWLLWVGALALLALVLLFVKHRQNRGLASLLSAEQQKMAQQDHLFKTITELALVGIFVASNNRILLSNPALQGLLAFSQEQLLQLSWWELIDTQDHPLFRAALANADQAQSVTLRINGQNDQFRWVVMHFRSLNASHQGWITGTISDIHQQKQAERQLRYENGLNRLMADISADLIRLDRANFDQGLNQVLAKLGRFFHVDRSYLFVLRSSDRALINTHEWVAPGVKGFRELLDPIAMADQRLYQAKREGRDRLVPDTVAMSTGL